MGYFVLFGLVSVLVCVTHADFVNNPYLAGVANSLPKDVSVEFPVCTRASTYYLPHESYCDLYYTCHQGHATMGQCEDGLVFDLYQGCRMYHVVDCSRRPKLQYAKGNDKCPRLNGIFKDPRGCGYFYKCSNGTAFSDQCPQGQMFEDKIKGCRLGTEREIYDCNTPSVPYQVVGSYVPVDPKPVYPVYQVVAPVTSYTGVAGFECPRNDVYPYGEHSRHPYPGSCIQYIMCMRDKTIKVGSCDAGYVFNPRTGMCAHPELVPGCF